MSAQPRPELSIVVPLYNEEESLPLLVEKLLAALRPLGRSFVRRRGEKMVILPQSCRGS
jgi:hypothetical protein